MVGEDFSNMSRFLRDSVDFSGSVHELANGVTWLATVNILSFMFL